MAGSAASPPNGRLRASRRAARSRWPPVKTICRQPARCGAKFRPGAPGFASMSSACGSLLPERPFAQIDRIGAGDPDVAQYALAEPGELVTLAAAPPPLTQRVEHPLARIAEPRQSFAMPDWPRAAPSLR